MNILNIPGFTADASVSDNRINKYGTQPTGFLTSAVSAIVPSMRPNDWNCVKGCLRSGQDFEFCWWACDIR